MDFDKKRDILSPEDLEDSSSSDDVSFSGDASSGIDPGGISSSSESSSFVSGAGKVSTDSVSVTAEDEDDINYVDPFYRRLNAMSRAEDSLNSEKIREIPFLSKLEMSSEYSEDDIEILISSEGSAVSEGGGESESVSFLSGPSLSSRDSGSFTPESLMSPEVIDEPEEFLSSALEIGEFVNNRYEIVKILHETKLQITYLVRDDDTGKRFILKEIVPGNLPSEDLAIRKRRYLDTARLLMNNPHPNLVSILNVFSVGVREYCLIEYFEGLSMEALMNSAVKGLSEKELLQFCTQIFEAVEFLHYRPQPFTLDGLESSHIVVGLDRSLKLADYDFQRFFDPSRKLDNFPDDPTKLYRDITRLASIFFYLLTKERFEKRSRDFQWPENVSLKLRKLLETSCTDGQMTYGDIKVFRKVFLSDPKDDEIALSLLKKPQDNPYQQFDIFWFSRSFEFLKRQSMFVKVVELLFVLFLLFMAVANPFRAKGYTRPLNVPLVYVFASNYLYTINADTFEILDERSVGFSSEDSLFHRFSENPAQGVDSGTRDVLIACNSTGTGLSLIDVRNNTIVSQIDTGRNPFRFIHDDKSEKLWLLHKTDSRILEFDLRRFSPIRALRIDDFALYALAPSESRGFSDHASISTENRKLTGLVLSPRSQARLISVDPETSRILDSVRLHFVPGPILRLPGSNTILCLSRENSKLVKIDSLTGALSGEIKLPVDLGEAYDLTFDRTQNLVWVTFMDSNTLVSCNPSTEKVVEKIPLKSTKPSNIYYRASKKQLWILCRGSKEILVRNASTGSNIGNISLGRIPDNLTIVE